MHRVKNMICNVLMFWSTLPTKSSTVGCQTRDAKVGSTACLPACSWQCSDCNLTLCHAQVVLPCTASPVCHEMNEEFDLPSPSVGFAWTRFFEQNLTRQRFPLASSCVSSCATIFPLPSWQVSFPALSETRTLMKSKLGGRTKLINFRSLSRSLFYRMA